MTAASLNLTARDFEAYVDENVPSKAHGRAGVEWTERAMAWANGVAKRIAELGVSLEVHASDDAATVGRQSIYFSREALAHSERARANEANGLTPDAVLALKLDAQAVEVCFEQHQHALTDVENSKGRRDAAADGRFVDAMVRAIESLPEQFEIGVGTLGGASGDRVPCASIDAKGFVSALARATEAPLVIGWRIPRATALEHTAILDEQLEDALVALAPIYRLAARSRDNDHTSRLDGVRRARERAHASAREKAERLLADRSLPRARSGARERARAGKPRGASKPTPLFDASPLEKGARVRVRSGPFVDKVGTVSEIDGRGGARVMLGLLSSRFELADLDPVVEGRDRPALQSSHKRPGQAPRKAR